MPQIHLKLFGSFYATLDGEPLTKFRSDKVRALLAYLVLEGHTPVNRIHLVNLLWHGYSTSAARISLRVALYNLRKVIAPLDLLMATRHTVQLHYQKNQLRCDVIDFETLVNAHQNQPTYESWQAIQNIYSDQVLRGFEYLDSAPFVRWRAQLEERLRQQMTYLRPPHS